jgi:hypothetical protein
MGGGVVSALGTAGNAISPPQSHPHQSEGGDGDCRQEWVGWDQAGPRAPERCGAAGWPATGAGQGQGGPPTLGRCGAELRTPAAGPPPLEEVGGAGGHTWKARPRRGRQPPGGGGGTAATPPSPLQHVSVAAPSLLLPRGEPGWASHERQRSSLAEGMGKAKA